MTSEKWWDVSWNPMTGCSPVSEACEHCYAEGMARRFWKPVAGKPSYPFEPTFHPERLDQPLHWRRPRRVFVCSMSDLFHEAFTDEQIGGVFDMFDTTMRHTFMVLTKRPERARELLTRWHTDPAGRKPTPVNLWLGVTAENQQRADERIPILLDTPAAVRFVSIEPMLSAADLRPWLAPTVSWPKTNRPKLDWVILGGETGPGARPMQPEWALDVYRQCREAGVPLFFKKWGSGKQADDELLRPAQIRELQAMAATREFPGAGDE